MSKPITPELTASETDGYRIGYGKPPTHSRFRPGQSGNPAGRRKGVRNLMTDVKRTLSTLIKVREDGRRARNRRKRVP
jgi:hypothetical protein